MRVTAPGKLVLTGAYAVLTGAPAIVIAVDRRAVADTGRVDAHPAPEVRAALGGEKPAPAVDVSAFRDPSGRKLGLGSSAAAVVASVAAVAPHGDSDLSDPTVRAEIFRTARKAHAEAQGGGSGVDVAASVYGGVLRYSLERGMPDVRAIDWPCDLVVAAYFAGWSARTSDLLERVAALKTERPRELAPVAGDMAACAVVAAEAAQRGSGTEFVRAAADYGDLLAVLGKLSDAPIVPAAFAELASMAKSEGAAFLPSGAGGGDAAIWLGAAAPSASVTRRAEALGVQALNVSIDRDGVRREALS